MRTSSMPWWGAPPPAGRSSTASTVMRGRDTGREAEMSDSASRRSRRGWLLAILGFLGVAGLTVLLLALLGNIFERKQEARQPFVRVVEITENTLDPKIWGQNWPYEYDSYLKTALPTTTKYGGRGLGANDARPAPQQLD